LRMLPIIDGGGEKNVIDFKERLSKLHRLRISDLQQKGRWEHLKREIRKYYFSFFKNLSCNLTPFIDEMLSFIISESCILVKALVIDIILDIIEIFEISKCNRVTKYFTQHLHYFTSLNTLYSQCDDMHLKFKLTELKIIYSRVHRSEEGITENELRPFFHDVYQIMKVDNCLYGVKVFDLGGATMFCFLNKDITGAFFFSEEGLVLEAKVDEICLLKRKDLFYISIKGNDFANC
jgi:hypothetical protein